MTTSRRRVVVVGGGAAGMSCAATLAKHPEQFHVTLIEKEDHVGGQATSIDIDEAKFGASWMNNGVQGGSKIFKHTFNFFRKYGSPPEPVQLQVSFGKGPSGFWTNCFPSQLVSRFSSDIKRFGTLLGVVKWTLPVIGLVPISVLLRLFFFSRDFGEKMVFPLIALFLGTGNQTPHVPSGIVERLFDDPNMKLWDYDSETLLPNLPTMYTFSNLSRFYQTWQDDLKKQGVEILTSTEVKRVVSRSKDNVKLEIRDTTRAGDDGLQEVEFDDMVLCVLADAALAILGRSATLKEKLVLGGARFYDDVTVTHHDKDYFERHYETTFKPELCAEAKSEAQKKQIAFATGDDGGVGFRPMYYTYTSTQDPKLIEMSFDCSGYQHQFRGLDRRAVDPVYQTIFLDKRRQDTWTMGEIDSSKIIKTNWWHQLGHRWQHYLRVVPGMMFIQGRQSTYYAGSWTLVNMHEVACVSGIAAAYRLGATYDKIDEFAEDFFTKYLLLSHGKVFVWEEKKRKPKSE